MSEIKINVDLDLETKKAKEQLDSFKKSVKNEDIPVRLDLSKIKKDANSLKNILVDAFKLDANTLGNLKQVENSLKQINKLIKTQSDLTNKTNSNKSNIFNPITINKNTDIVKDVDTLVDDYKNAKKQLESLDQMGQSMLRLLDDFNANQKNTFEKFVNESKQYDVYLKHLEGDNLTSALKQAIDKRKKAIKLQEELTQLGVIKVNNDQLRNEKYDGSIFTIDNEKWKAMFAKTEGEARDLEDMARKIKPKIDSANKDVLELIKGFSNDERKLFEQISKAYEQRPQFNHLSGFDSDNINTLKLYLENAIPDVDKMGLDFDRFDDIFRGLDRFYSRLEQMQNEYNSKFANEDGFKPIRLDSLLDIEQNEAKRIIQEAESNNDLLDNVLKNRLNILNKDYAGDNLDLGINESSLKNMEQFINLSKLVNKSISQSSSKESSLSKDVKDYLAVTKKINELQSQLYKSDANGTTSISKSIQNEIDLMRQKQLTYASAIRANKDLYESVKDQIKIEEQLSNLRRTTKETIVDTDALNKLDKTYKELDKIQDKLQSMQNTKGFLDNSLVEKTNSLLSETRSKLDANGIESDFKEISNSVELLNKNLKSLSDNNTLGKQEANFNISLQNMENKIDSFIDKCKEMGNAEHLIERVEHAFKGINTDNIERANVDLKQMASVLNQAEREARQLSSTMDSTRSFFGNFSQEFKDNLFTFTAGELLADGIRNVTSSLKDLVMEYDTAMTNLKKVANPADIMDVKQLDAIQKKAVSIAKNVGQSSQDTIQAIADTIQMSGLGMEASTMVAEQTMMLANVAEMTQEAASKGVVTMLSSFNLDPLKEIPLVVNGATKSVNEMVDAMDKINHVGNNFAISSDGILDAITSGANVLHSYGVSMNDTIAMVTAANTTLQDTSRVGNGLKTISTKLAGIKTSAKDGTMSLNKTAMALKEIAGINVFSNESKGELKDMATIIEELGAKWEGFSDKQKAGLSEAIAGANQASVFQSLMQNIDVMKQVQSELANGDHFQSMAQENAQYVDSISGKLNKLKETWVGVFNTLFNSNAAKGIIDVLISVSEVISKVIETLDDLGMLTPLLVGLGATLTSKAFSGIGSIFKVGSQGIGEFTKSTGILASIIPKAAEGLGKFGLTGTKAGVALLGAKDVVGGFLSTASSFIPWAVAAGVAVAGVSSAVDYFNESLDEEEQRLDESIAARKENISSLNEQKGKLQEIQEEYDKLSNKPNKTASEVERLKKLTEELAQIKPELVVGYDEGGNPILSMTGDVKDLIKEIDRAVEGKERLLRVETQESAKNAVQQLHGKDKSGTLYGNMFNSEATGEMDNLEKLTSKHVSNMSKLEAERDKILNKLYEATGQERQKLLKDLDKANYEIEKAQDEYVNNYQEQLDVIKEYSNKIGEGLFSSLENSYVFKDASEELKASFSSLKEYLDFSDIKTEDQLLDAEHALNRLLIAAKKGDVDLDKLKSSIEKANAEFAKTGDSEKYSKNIDNIIKTLKEIPGLEHIDFDVLKDMFEGIDTSVTKGEDALDKFLRAYNKTAADIEKGDAFAKALAEQKRQIEEALGNLEITEDVKINSEIAWDLVGNTDLPSQLRDMVRVLLNKNQDPTEVLKFAQRVMIDLSKGEVDIDELQKLLDEKFGEGAFEITPEILLNDNSRIAGVETVIKQINDKFGEIPPTVKTIIEAEGITAFNEAKRLTELYLAIPEEVRTKMTNNGLESAKDVVLVNQLLNNLPESVVTNIVNNFPEVFEGAESIEDVINNLPASVLMEIKNNYPEVVEKSKLLQEAIDNIPATKESKVSVVEEIKKEPMSLLDRLFGRNKTEMTATAAINMQVNGLDQAITARDVLSSFGFKGSGASGSSGTSSNKRSIDPYGISAVEEVSDLARSTSKSTSGVGGSANGFNVTIDITVNGMDDLKQLQEALNNFKVSNVKATISVETAQAAKNITGLVNKINEINKKKGKTFTYKSETSQAAKNITGLISKLNSVNKLNGKTFKYSSETAQASKNITGLINKINEINKKNGKTFTWNAETAQAAKNISGLINRIDQINGKKSKTFSYSVSTSFTQQSLDDGIATVSSVADNIAAQTSNIQASLRTGTGEISSFSSNMARATSKTPISINYNNSIDALRYNIDLLQELENRIDKVNNSISLLDKQMEHAVGREKIKYLKQQNSLYKEQIDLQKELESSLKKQQANYLSYLQNQGFSFNSDGNLTNYEEKLIAMQKEAERLNQLADSASSKYYDYTGDNETYKNQLKSAYDTAKKKADDYAKSLSEIEKCLNAYIDVTFTELPKVQEEWQELENAYKNSLREQLETTKEIEDKLTDIYKKQKEDRIDAINEETDARIKALKKQKDAYNKYRDEADYKEEYNEKLQEITDLQKKLDIAMRDTSLNGQKKVQDLQTQIAQAQKELQKLTQDKIDQNINDMFDKESERIEEENEKRIEALENQWSDSKIAEMVAQALGSGVFIDIEGNVSSLEDALVNFANETGELFGALGTVIKSELITNLGIAKDTVGELVSIMKDLDLSSYMSVQNTRSISDVTSRMGTSNSYSNTNNQVSINAPLIHIEGNVDNDVVDKLEDITNKVKEQVIDAIYGSIR